MADDADKRSSAASSPPGASSPDEARAHRSEPTNHQRVNVGSDPPRGFRHLIALSGVLLASWTLWATAILPSLPQRQGAGQAIQSIGARLVLWVLPCIVYLQRRYSWAWVSLFGARRGGLMLPPSLQHWAGALGLCAAAAAAVSVDVARQLGATPAQVWLYWSAALEWRFPTAPLFEELVFRGVVMGELLVLLGAEQDIGWGQRVRRAWLANLGASLIFTGLHWPWWIYTSGFSVEVARSTAGVFLISLVLGMVFVRGRSLWPCVLLHWLNNSLSELVQ